MPYPRSALAHAVGVVCLVAGARAEPPAAPVTLDPVVVIGARLRPEDSLQVPVSATVLGAQEMEELGVSGFDRVGQTVPNLNVQRRFGPGSGPLLSLRGQDAGTISFESDNRVGMYLDDVYMGRIGAMSAFALADLCGMEALRGPQGTLFGAGAAGGVIRLKTCKPAAGEISRISLGLGNFGQRQARASFNAEGGEGLSARFTLLRDQRDGWARNASAGTVTQLSEPFGTVVAAERLGGAQTTALALALRYEGTAGLTLDYRYDRTNKRDTQAPVQLLGVFGGIAGLYEPAAGAGGARPELRRQDLVAEDFLSASQLAVDGHSLKAEYRWNGQSRAQLILSTHSMVEIGGGNDIDGATFNGRFLSLSGIDTPASDRACYLCSTTYRSLRQGSGELRLLHKAGAWDWAGGLFLFREAGLSDGPVFIGARFQPDVLNPVGGLSRFVNSDYYSGRKVEVVNQSLAAYAHASYRFSEALTLAAGLRRTLDRRSTETLLSTRGSVGGRNRFDYSDGEAAADYQFTPGVFAYGRFSTAHMAGGTQAGLPFAPEFTRSAELGLKMSNRERTLRFAVSAFHNRITHQQLSRFSPDVGIFVVDAGAATQEGLELELQAQATRSLLLRGSYGYIQAGSDIGLRALTPRQTLYLGAEYALPPLHGGALPVLRVDASWRSEAAPGPCLIGQSTTPQGCTGTGDAALTRRVSMPARMDLSARLSLKQIELGHALTGEVSLWVRNLLDHGKLQFARDLGNGTVIGSFEEPRTLGAEFSVCF